MELPPLIDFPKPGNLIVEDGEDWINCSDEKLLEIIQKKRSSKKWNSEEMLKKISDFVCHNLEKIPKKTTIDNIKSFNQNQPIESIEFLKPFFTYQIFNGSDETVVTGVKQSPQIISREQSLIALRRLQSRENDELTVLMDALVDYEIMNVLIERFKNDSTEKELRKTTILLLLMAKENLYHLISLSILSVEACPPTTLKETARNLHLFNKELIVSKPSFITAFSNFLLRFIETKRNFNSFDQLLQHVSKANKLAFFFNHVKLSPSENFSNYSEYYAIWFGACFLPKFLKCFHLYKPSSIFGYNFLHDLFDWWSVEFRNDLIEEEPNSKIDDFINLLRKDFFDSSKPHWKESFRSDISKESHLLLKVQDRLINSICEKTPSNSFSFHCKNNNLSTDQIKSLLELYQTLLKLKWNPPSFSFLSDCQTREDSKKLIKLFSEDSSQSSKSTALIPYHCHFCDQTNNYIFCFIHDRLNKVEETIPANVLIKPNTLPDDWFDVLLVKLVHDELMVALFTSEKFDAAKAGLQERIEYLTPVGEPNSGLYRIVINASLLLNVKRPKLLNFLKTSKPRSKFYSEVYGIFYKMTNEMPRHVKWVQNILPLSKGINSSYGKIFNPALNFNKYIYTSFVNETSPSFNQTIISNLVGLSAPYEPLFGLHSISGGESEQVLLIHNTLLARQNEHISKLLIDVQNVFTSQLPRMGKEYIARLVQDPRHKSLVFVRNGHRAVAAITFRPFKNQGFCEIVFCAVNSSQQIKGYGSRLMNYLKDYCITQEVNYLLTFADEYAVGYFKKLGFSDRITMPENQYKAWLKDYEGALLMECRLIPGIVYKCMRQVISMQKTIVEKMIEIKQQPTWQHRFKFDYRTGSHSPRQVIPLEFLEKQAAKSNVKCNFKKVDFGNHSEEIIDELEDILNEIKKHSEAKTFVEMCQNPDYISQFRYPMDLDMVDERLKKRRYYVNVHLFHCDMKRTFENFKSYHNSKENLRCVKILQRHYIDLMKKRLSRLKQYGPGILLEDLKKEIN